MNKVRLIIGFLLFSIAAFGQVKVKNEPTNYNYSRGAGRMIYTATDNLCYLRNCETQITRVSNTKDINKFNATNADESKWIPFHFYELSEIDSALIPWKTVYLTEYLTRVDSTHFFGRFNYDSPYVLWSVIPGTIKSQVYGDYVTGLKFYDIVNVGFVGRGCQGSIIYNDDGYLTIAITTSNPAIVDYYGFKFSFYIKYYRKNKAKVEFDVPPGYWAWFIKGSGGGVSGKIEINNTGRSHFLLGNDIVPIKYQDREIRVNF